jgi:hypothetical protein
MAGPLPGEIHQRRQSPLHPYQEGQESSFDCAPCRRAVFVSGPELHGRVLPSNEVEAGHASCGYSDGTQTRASYITSTREPYNESLFLRLDEAAAQRAETRLRKQAAKLGFQIVPNPA